LPPAGFLKAAGNSQNCLPIKAIEPLPVIEAAGYKPAATIDLLKEAISPLMKRKRIKTGDEIDGNAMAKGLSRRAAIKRIAAVLAGAAIGATGAGKDQLASTADAQTYSSSYVSLNIPYVRYSSWAYLSLVYSSIYQYSSIYVPPWRP